MTLASLPADTHVSPSGAKLMPRTAPACPSSFRSGRDPGMSQIRISPSADPATRLFSFFGLRASAVMPSAWGSAVMKGFAKTRSSLAALSARAYSVAFVKLCSAGS